MEHVNQFPCKSVVNKFKKTWRLPSPVCAHGQYIQQCKTHAGATVSSTPIVSCTQVNFDLSAALCSSTTASRFGWANAVEENENCKRSNKTPAL